MLLHSLHTASKYILYINGLICLFNCPQAQALLHNQCSSKKTATLCARWPPLLPRKLHQQTLLRSAPLSCLSPPALSSLNYLQTVILWRPVHLHTTILRGAQEEVSRMVRRLRRPRAPKNNISTVPHAKWRSIPAPSWRLTAVVCTAILILLKWTFVNHWSLICLGQIIFFFFL